MLATSCGPALVMDEATYDFTLWALDLPQVLDGRYPADRRIMKESNPIFVFISPDGTRLMVRRDLTVSPGHPDQRFTTMPFAGGPEMPLDEPGSPTHGFWTDSVTFAFVSQTPTGSRLEQIDMRSGARRNALDVRDSVLIGRSGSRRVDVGARVPGPDRRQPVGSYARVHPTGVVRFHRRSRDRSKRPARLLCRVEQSPRFGGRRRIDPERRVLVDVV